jgi:hypothetical protein
VTAPKKRIKGKHLHIDHGGGTKEIRKISKSGVSASPAQNAGITIDIDEKTAQGSYANAAAVAHSETEFILDFLFLQPNQPSAKIRDRVISSPKHTKRFARALAENIRKYEETYGPVQ